MIWTHRHLLAIEPLSREELLFLLDTAAGFEDVSQRSVKKLPSLRGRVVCNLFYEDSTRTRMSFELAAQRLSADVLNFSAQGSSVSKGESLKDTVTNIQAMGVDIFVIRHPVAGAPLIAASATSASVINAGDGRHEHPTQALLDLYTIRKLRGEIEGLHVAIVGDITNSRVARSNIWGLTRLGARVSLVGPATLVPGSFASIPGVSVSHCLDDVVPDADVLMALRIQKERIAASAFPSLAEYTRLFGLTRERLARARPDVIIMHPGPMNRGVEMDSAVADDPRSAILLQVRHGLAVRMAAMFLVTQASAS